MHSIDYFVVCFFTVAVVIAGLSFGRGNSDMESFFAAGGAVPWPISGLSLFMSFFSAGTFVVWGSIAYEYGWVAVTIQWTMCIAGLIIGILIAPKWREANVLTAAEFINKRLGISVQQFYTYLFLVLSLFTTGAFLYPVAVIVNVATGFGISETTIVLGLLIILYTTVGGLWAVVVTDVLQFVILTVAVLIVVPLSLESAGGISGFMTNAPDDFFNLLNGEYTFGFMVAFALYNLIYIGGNWAYVQRFTMVKDKKSAQKVGYLFSALYIITPVIWMLPPMLYRITEPGLAGLENEGAYLMMVKEVLPVGMLGLMLGGIVFATASSVNTTLNLAAAVVTNDIYRNLQPSSSNKQLMFIGRIATIIFGVGTIGVALLVPVAGGIVEVVLSIGAITGAPLFAPPIWALFSKRQSGKSIILITLLSLGINLFFKFVTPVLWDFSLDRAMEMIFGVGGTLLMLSCYEIWAIYKERISPQYIAYIRQIRKEKDVNEKLKASVDTSSEQNRYGLQVISISLAFTGGLIVLLSLLADNANVLVGSMGALILVIAYIIWKLNRRRYEKVPEYHDTKI
ncbi:transporter, SSS family [Fodinibius roseus]|uniref:Transporter, SSS family n=1 Tax=Fodinibius roseus TaxID=1194090 RepID=A0A1M5FY03_9BACT|nr:sodium:solute symporter family protein [Fodinibius roseus]SHF96440.1 transporter, SSS family [Fodinibius roseus]